MVITAANVSLCLRPPSSDSFLTARILCPVAGQLRAAEKRQHEHEAGLAAAQGSQSEAAAIAARLERQLAILGKERDGLKRILASYQQDDARACLTLFCNTICSAETLPG